MARPLPLFGLFLDNADLEGPENVRVFEDGRFLYGSFDHGREQVLDVRAHDRLDLLEYWVEWMRPDLSKKHPRTPSEPARAPESSDASGEFSALPKKKPTRG